MFELTKQEFENLMSKKSTSSWGGRRKLPKTFIDEMKRDALGFLAKIGRYFVSKI